MVGAHSLLHVAAEVPKIQNQKSKQDRSYCNLCKSGIINTQTLIDFTSSKIESASVFE